MDYPKLEADAETGTNLRTKLLPEQTWKEKENQSSWRACCIKYKKHLANGAILLTFCLILVGLFVRNYEAFLDSISHVAQQDKKTEILNLSLEEEPTGGFNVLVIGDWGRHGLYNQSAVAQQMTRVAKEMEVEFIISVGDNFYPSGLTRVDDPAFNQSFSQVYDIQSLPKTWHSVLGNHDYRGDALAQLDPALRVLDPRWHCERSFSLARVLADGSYVEFFFYDTNPFVEDYWNNTKHTYDWRGVEPKDDYLKKQKEFLSNGLAVSNATWKVVVGHHPIRSVGVHGDTLELQDQIYPILKEHDVDLYVNGHDHCLEHITECGIHFVTSGGGSKAWRGMDSSADQTGLQFYYDGQGFVSISFNSSILSFAFYDSIGNTLHNVYLSK
eukprot:c23807_g1_i1 orf=265-1419(-)